MAHHFVVFLSILLCSLVLVTNPAAAQFDFRGGQQQRSAGQLTRVQLITDTSDALMPGETIHLAVVFSIADTWHLYWKNPGAGAPPPDITVNVPNAYAVGDVRWPRPITIEGPMGDMYCYEDEFALFIPVTAPAELEDGEVTFSVDVNWAVCDKDVCLFGDVTRDITLSTTSSTVRTLEARPIQPKIAKHRPRLPRSIDGERARAELRDETVRVVVPADDFETATFFPHSSPGVRYGEPRIEHNDGRFELVVELQINPNNFTDGPPNIGGLIALGESKDDPSYEFSLPLQQ